MGVTYRKSKHSPDLRVEIFGAMRVYPDSTPTMTDVGKVATPLTPDWVCIKIEIKRHRGWFPREGRGGGVPGPTKVPSSDPEVSRVSHVHRLHPVPLNEGCGRKGGSRDGKRKRLASGDRVVGGPDDPREQGVTSGPPSWSGGIVFN